MLVRFWCERRLRFFSRMVVLFSFFFKPLHGPMGTCDSAVCCTSCCSEQDSMCVSVLRTKQRSIECIYSMEYLYMYCMMLHSVSHAWFLRMHCGVGFFPSLLAFYISWPLVERPYEHHFACRTANNLHGVPYEPEPLICTLSDCWFLCPYLEIIPDASAMFGKTSKFMCIPCKLAGPYH